MEKRNSVKKDVEGVDPWDFFPSYRCSNKHISAGRWTCHMEKCIGGIFCGVQKPSLVQYDTIYLRNTPNRHCVRIPLTGPLE